MKKGILFDLDGTLWDSSQAVIDAWNECIAKNTDLGRSFTREQMQSYMGKTLEKIAELMFPDLPEKERVRILKMCSEYELEYLKSHSAEYFAGEREVLEALHKEYFMAVVSNCQDGYIQLFLEKSGYAGLFDDFECAGRTGLDKGDNIKLVAQRGELDGVIYVGDTDLDGQAARKAGVPFVHAGYGFGSPDDFDIRINDISELPSAAEKLLK